MSLRFNKKIVKFFIVFFVAFSFSLPVSALTEYDPVSETLEIDGKYIKLDDYDNILKEYYNRYDIISDSKSVEDNPFNISSSLKLAFDSNSALLNMVKDGLKIGRDELNNSSVKFFPNGIKVANELLNYDTIDKGTYIKNNSYFFVCNNSEEYIRDESKITFSNYFRCSVSAVDQSGKEFFRTFSAKGDGPYFLNVIRTSTKDLTVINVNSLTDSIGTSNAVSSWLNIKFEGDLPVSGDVINYDNCLDSSSVSPSGYPTFRVPVYSDSSCTNLVDSNDLPIFTSNDVPGNNNSGGNTGGNNGSSDGTLGDNANKDDSYIDDLEFPTENKPGEGSSILDWLMYWVQSVINFVLSLLKMLLKVFTSLFDFLKSLIDITSELASIWNLLFGFLPSPIPELVVLTFSCVIVISFIHFLK